MSNCGKYVDRNPSLRAAGKCFVSKEKTEDALKIFSTEEAAENILLTKCRLNNKNVSNDVLPFQRYIPEENIKELLSPELKKSRFVVFREKFAENMYFKKPELGKVFPLDSKPQNVTNDNTTFGDSTIRSESLYDLILPRKSPDEVNREYVRWHEKYIISHGHYLPSEQLSRHYKKPFDKNNHFGTVYDVDFNGKYVKRAIQQCDNLIIISKAQKQFLERTLGRLGRSIYRENRYITPEMSFGAPSGADECNVKALMEIQDQCEGTSPLITALGHLNKVRQKLFERHNFHMQDLKLALENHDIKKTGLLTLKEIFEILRREGVYCNSEKITTALRHFKLIENEGLPTEGVKYEELWKLIHVQYPIPKTGNISKMPPNIYNKETTYRLLCQDRNKPPVEAIPSKPFDTENAEEPTTVKDVISPDIPMHFGLAPSDFAKLRPKEELRRIFKRLLDAEKFDITWETAQNKLKRSNELISVDELRQAMNSHKD
ncbi:PREDICTED: EF-hand domain-containing family member B-like [Bactrocera latifrons]|uniref:EF-hand domain-containing family member B n=2 Tax=Bactrocera latifrons TaxID=174628 RepID=A0A0K8U5P5_BACLA|nr:PREDICTED: EF-hand domain-containing family member B-like [Bactrocera latifrons]